MKPLGYQDPTHTVDVQVTALEDADWKGKMIFKIPRDEQARKLHNVIEDVRTVVDRLTRPDPQEYERDRSKTEVNRKSRRECPACAADSIGLCSIHDREIFEIRDEEHQNDLVTVTAEAAKGGIPDNFDDQEGKKEESTDKPTPEEERDAAIEEEEIGRLFDDIERDVNIGRDCSESVGPELLEAENREIARELAPLGDKKRRDALDRRRRSDRDEANTTMHLLAHSPKNVHCIACRQAKVTNVRFTRGDHEFIQFAKEFGDRVTADTIVLRNAKDRGVHGGTIRLRDGVARLHTSKVEKYRRSR